MSDAIQEFLGELTVEGEKAGATTSFTLSSAKAREKLKKFALEHPENYYLLVVAGLQSFGGRNFDFRVDADDLVVTADCRLSRQGLGDIWAYVSGGMRTADSEGLRLIALAMLTSVRFERAHWTIQSSDELGFFRFEQRVIAGDLPEPILLEEADGCSQTRISVKRQNLRQVTSRFLSQLKDRLLARVQAEELVISERVFLGTLESFEMNGRALDCRLEAEPALAILRQGKPPQFLTSRYACSKDGEFSLVCLINPVDSEDAVKCPGEPGKVSWLWHGLRMGVSDLGLPYKFCRVFFVADGMQTDLSFSALSATWKRQKAERAVRDGVRSLLEFLALQYTASQGDKLESCDPQLEEVLVKVLRERIDVSRSRIRLASFNRSLIACPLFVGSAEDGVRRRFTLNELWQRRGKGETLACFSCPSEWEPVPAWAD